MEWDRLLFQGFLSRRAIDLCHDNAPRNFMRMRRKNKNKSGPAGDTSERVARSLYLSCIQRFGCGGRLQSDRAML